MTQTAMLEHYLETCNTAGSTPNEKILDVLRTRFLPAESSQPFSTLDDEAAMFERMRDFYATSTSTSDRVNGERADAIAKQMRQIISWLSNVTENAYSITAALQQLNSLKYTRLDRFKAAVAAVAEEYLRKYLQDNISMDLVYLAKYPTELHISYLKDAFVLYIVNTDDLYKRLKSVLSVAEVAESLFKLTAFQSGRLPDTLFLMYNNEFEAQLSTISKNFALEEVKCAKIIVDIFYRLEKNSIGVLMYFKGVLRRKGVRNYLASIFGHLTVYCKNFIDEVDVLCMKVQYFCYRAAENSITYLCDYLVEIKKYRVRAADYYGVAQLLLLETSEFEQLRNSFKSVASGLKSRQDELLRAAKVRMDLLTVSCRQIKYVLNYTERGEFSVNKGGILDLAQLYCLLYNMDLLQYLSLPNDTVSAVQTGLGCMPSMHYLADIATYYNNLSRSVKTYQKPLLLNAATVFESELRKVAQNSYFVLGTGQKDAGTVERIYKITTHIVRVQKYFDYKLQLLSCFHTSQAEALKNLIKTPLGRHQLWVDEILAMRMRLNDFLRMIPSEVRYSVYLYWSCALAHVLSLQYGRALGTDLGQLRQLRRIVITSAGELSPTVEEIYDYLFAYIYVISALPASGDFHLCDYPKINAIIAKMAELSVGRLPKVLAVIYQIVRNLTRFKAFMAKECAVVLAATSRDYRAFAEALPTLEHCRAAFYRAGRSLSEFTQNSVEFSQNLPKGDADEAYYDEYQIELRILAEFDFLITVPGERGVCSVYPSGGCVTIDVGTAVRYFAQKGTAICQIAAGASKEHAERLSTQTKTEIDAILDKMTVAKEGESQSAEAFLKFTQWLEEAYKVAGTRIREYIQQVQQFYELIHAATGEEPTKAVIAALAAYEKFYTALANTGKTLESRKTEMQEHFRAYILADALPRASKASAILESAIEDIRSYCERSSTVKMPPGQSDANSVFLELSRGTAGLAAHYSKFGEVYGAYDYLGEIVAKIDADTYVLYGKSYGALLSAPEHSNVKRLLEQGKVIYFVAKISNYLLEIEQSYAKLLSMDWGVLRLKFEQQEILYEAYDKFKQIDAVESDFPTESFEQLKRLQKAQLCYATFMYKSAQATVYVIKVLKSQALYKNHWHEIADKTNIISAIKAFSQSPAVNLPDALDGASLHYIVAANLFPTPVTLLLEAVSNEFKRFMQAIREIVARAEGELTVRAAVEEVDYYLHQDARVAFKLLRLSGLTQYEVGNTISCQCIPITAVWKPILTALTEKKAVLQSVLSNPFNKSIKEQIDANSYIIEAMTRLAHVLIALQRQIVVLEPVMARRVLPEYHDKFYYTMRQICFIMVNSVEAANRGKLAGEENQVSIGLIAILRIKLPTALITRQGKSAFDNSKIGPYADIILQLESAYAMLQEVYSSLRLYLEKKRLSFPRFYFLADQDVLEILANANAQPERTLCPHVKKLFSSVEKLVFEGTSIVGIESSETEKVMLKFPIKIDGPPELWLRRLDTCIKETLKSELMAVLQLGHKCDDPNRLKESDDFDINHSYQQVKSRTNVAFLAFDKLAEAIKASFNVNGASGEILAIAFAVLFTAQVDYALLSEKVEELLQKTLLKTEQYLNVFTAKLFAPEISTATYGTSNYVLNLKLKALATDTTHYVAVCKALIYSTSRQWDWNREIKYRVHKDSYDLYLCALDTDLPYTFEYYGLPARLIHTPLTDRCYSTLISALSCSISSNPQGPAGTGKTETVKAFAAKLARPCIVFNCDSAIDRENLSRILIGIILSGSVGCFDEINRLSPAVLSAVSTDIENIYNAILDKSVGKQNGQLMLADIAVPIAKVSAFSAVFVTMNPASREYRGRSELPFSLVKLLRGCFMGKADVSLIMQTILATSGFKYAEMWAVKVDLAYALAMRRIPKEVHLDWGLRSLQAVLRQSALARASKLRSFGEKQLSSDELLIIERQVVIKSLSDATFSRLRNRSASIFAEILTDIFGKYQTAKANKFGAVSDVEMHFVNAIGTSSERLGMLTLQLYRALTSKLGVALLGNSASGKTTIWNLLKSAVSKASNDRIVIQEYRIAPKAMSRQDLLGFVDANKEWVDGVLSKSARQAVHQLTQNIWPVLVFDGDIDPLWIESLNSSLDDNRLLSLSSGERIRFPSSLDPLETYFNNKEGAIPMPVSFLFETDSLQHASPATVSRLAVILVADPSVDEQKGIVSQMHEGLGKSMELLAKHAGQSIADLTSHMDIAGRGELLINPKSDYAIGALRCLHAECPAKLADVDYKQLAISISGNEIPLRQCCISPGLAEKDNYYTTQQSYAIRLLQTYLYAGASVAVAGPRGSTRYFSISEAAGLRDNYKQVTISCTFLTGRDDVLRAVYSECVEGQRLDGSRELRPRGNKKLLFILRDTDVVVNDEYGHSQIYTMLWSVVNYNMLYLKQGTSVFLNGIQFAITVQAKDSIPYRLLRRMGYVQLAAMQDADVQYVISDYSKDYAQLTKYKGLKQYLQYSIPKAEATKLQAKLQGITFAVALPEIMTACLPSYTVFAKIPRKPKLENEELTSILYCFIEARIPYAAGKVASRGDLKIFANDFGGKVFTVAYMTKTAYTISRMMTYDEPLPIVNYYLELTTLKVRANMLNELLTVAIDFYPGIRFYKKYLAEASLEELEYQLYLLSAIEMQLFFLRGALVVSYAYNFSFEAITMACLTLGLKIKIVGCDCVSSYMMKSIGEPIAKGFRVALLLDACVIYHDNQWIQAISAFSSKDTRYIRSYLVLADIRALVSVFGEFQSISELSEEDQITSFLARWVDNIYVVVHLNPEFQFVDNIYSFAPALRRNYGMVAFSIYNSSALNPQIQSVFKALYEKPVPMEKQLYGFIKAFFAKYLHESVAVSNGIYIRSLMLFNMLREKWMLQVKSRQEYLQYGLRYLSTAQAEVDSLAKEAEKSYAAIQLAYQYANTALKEISVKMEDVQKKQTIANQLQSQLSEKEVVITEKKNEAESKLATVMPILEEATKAVYSIPNDAMTEVKSFKSPPPAVNTVLEAVLTFMGNKDISWNGMRAFLSYGYVLRQIAGFDVKQVPVQRMQKVIYIVQNNPKAFEYSSIERVSKAAAPLAKWVQASLSYGQVFVQIEPLMKAAEEANQKLDELRKYLKQTSDEVKYLEAETQTLRENFNLKTQELMKCKAELEIIEVKKNRGQTMLQNLKSERERWILNEKDAGEQLKRVNNCALYACGLFVLTGNKTDDVREQMWKEYRKHIFSILVSSKFTDECRNFALRISGYALENVAIMELVDHYPGFVAVVLSYVTDYSGVLKFLQTKYQDVQFISAAAENLGNLLAIAARFGYKVIVTDCDSGAIPSAIVPYLRYGFVSYQMSESTSSQDPDDQIMNFDLVSPMVAVSAPAETEKQSEISPKFRLIIVSSVGIDVPSDLNGRVLELSFAPNEYARTDLYMDEVLREWSPATLQKIQDLNALQADLRGQLLQIEQKLLNALQQSKSSKNILEDENLLYVLAEANEQALKIKYAQNEAQAAENELASLKAQVQLIADAVWRSAYALDAISGLNDLYIIDDAAILPLLRETLRDLRPSSASFSSELIDQAISRYFALVHRRLGSMVFYQDRIGALGVLSRFCKPQQFNQTAFEMLAGTVRETSHDNDETVSWAGDKYQMYFQQIASALGPEMCKKVQFYSPQQWGSFISKALSTKSIDGVVPVCGNALSKFHQLALVSAVRFDLLSGGLARSCDELMDDPSIQTTGDLEFALRVSTSLSQPIILYTSKGQDPTVHLAAEIVALAPGRENDATSRLSNLLAYEKPPGIIVIKGAHLCIDWLAVLPARIAYALQNMPADQQQRLDRTRIVLLLEPKNSIPKGLSRVSWRICMYGSSSPRATMLALIGGWPQLKQPLSRFLAYTISALHTVFEGRLAYHPRGVANYPGWSGTDALALISIITQYSEAIGDAFSKDAAKKGAIGAGTECFSQLIAYARGYACDAVYGVQTKDRADEVLVSTLAGLVFSRDFALALAKYSAVPARAAGTVQENFLNVSEFSQLLRNADDFPFLKLIIPPFELLRTDQQQKLSQYVAGNFPDAPTADMLALTPAAMLTRGEKDSLIARSILSRAVSSTLSQQEEYLDSGGVYEAILRLEEATLATAATVREVAKKAAENAPKCAKTMALADEIRDYIQTLGGIIAIITQDIYEARTAQEDFLRAPPSIKQKAALLAAYIVPEAWCTAFDAPPVSYAPPDAPELVVLHTATPDSYVRFLSSSSSALADALAACLAFETKPGHISIRINLFPRPAAFCEAIRRYEGAIKQIELDRVVLRASLHVPRAPCVLFEKASCKLVGASYGAGFNYADNEQLMPYVALIAEAGGRIAPFYVDGARTLRMPLENLYFDANEGAQTFLDVYGVYACLGSR